MLWLSIKSFFSANKLLAVAFTVLLIVCLTGGLFGVNYTCSTVDIYNNYMSSQNKYEINGFANADPKATKEFADKYGERIGYAFATFSAEILGQTVDVDAFVCLNGEYNDIFWPMYGKGIKKEDVNAGEKKILLDCDKFGKDAIGKTVSIGGVECEVVGLYFGNSIISYFALEEKPALGKLQLNLNGPYRTDAEKKAFVADLNEIFPLCRVVAPEGGDLKTIFDYAPMLLPTAILIFLGFVNLAYLYAYFIKMRKKQYAVYRLSGASAGRIFFLFLAEVMSLFTVSYALSFAAYKITASALFPEVDFSHITDQMPIMDCMTFARYAAVFGVLAVMLIVAFIPSIIRTLKADASAKETAL